MDANAGSAGWPDDHPPAHSDAEFQLTVTATATETSPTSGDTTVTTLSALTSATIDVQVDAVADAPTLNVSSTATGDEDNAIALTINSSLVDADNSESLLIEISGVPSGATLSAGTDNSGGSWTLTPAQLAGLTITPPAHSDGEFQLTVTATASETNPTSGETTVTTLSASTSATIDVQVDAVADAPTLNVTSSTTGDEDSSIALTITSSLLDTDSSETLLINITGVPAGASLSAGTDNGGGSWTLTPAELSGLTITPPAHSDAEFQLTVTAKATETNPTSGDTTVTTLTASTSTTIDVQVDAVADAPTLNVTSSTTGDEDGSIALTISSSLLDADSSETLLIEISGIPAGATLSAGTDNGGGSWTLTPPQLAGLTITPPAHSDGEFQLTVTATASETNPTSGDTTVTTLSASTSATIDVRVDAVADAPTLNVTAAAKGDEDSSIALTITSSLLDADSSESLLIEISGVPVGATLSAGTDNGGGSWTLTPAQLAGLTITPAAHSDAEFQLTVTATASETNPTSGDTTVTTLSASTSATIDVQVDAVADAPTLNVTSSATGDEDSSIALTITSSLVDADSSETLLIEISGVPAGATLSAGTDNGGGSWTLTPAQLPGLTITPPAHSDAEFQLTVTATASETNPTSGDTTVTTLAASTSATIDVQVDAVADAPTLTITSAATGDEDSSIALSISSSLVDADNSETLSIEISGVPVGATLSAGTDNGGGSWTLTPAQLSGLTITPPAHGDAEFQLTVTATATETNPTSSDTTVTTLSASTSATIDVQVDAVADAPTLNVTSSTTGDEDGSIALTITSSLVDVDSSESLLIEISGVPVGASLSAGTDNGGGSWTLTSAQLAGLTITPPLHSDAEFQLTVTATASETNPTSGDTTVTTLSASTSATIDVQVDAVADAPTLNVTATATGDEDSSIALTITGSLVDTDNSETLLIEISGIPAGATLSAGTDNGGGSWTLTPAQLSGLTVTPPAHSDAEFQLTVTATASETNPTSGDTTVTTLSASTSATIDVQVDAVADAPTLNVTSSTTGDEDGSIALTISSSLVDADSSETLLIEISGVPAGATLSAGTDNGGGSWTLTPAQLSGLMITPPTHSDAEFQLTVTATASETNPTSGDTTVTTLSASTSATIDVQVDAVADAPTLNVSSTATGDEDNSIALTINSSLVDADNSESLLIEISGVPSGATLSAGTDNGGGSWTLTPAQLAGLTITPPSNSGAEFTLTVTATATESNPTSIDTTVTTPTAQTVATIDVLVNDVADAPLLSVPSTVNVAEDSASGAFSIASSLNDTDGSESLTLRIGNIPVGARLSDGGNYFVASSGNTTATVTGWDLNNLMITPPTDSDVDFTLIVTATATESANGHQTITSDSITVEVNAVADQPNLTVPSTVNVNEDTLSAPFAISGAIADTDASETLSFAISDVPVGVTISDGANGFTATAGNTTVDVTSWDLANLAVTPPTDSDVDFSITVNAIATEIANADQATRSATINVEVTAVADQPTLTVPALITVSEDMPSATFMISSALADADGSESLSIEVGDIPIGATITDGTSVFVASSGNTSVDVTSWVLNNLSVTAPADSDQDFTLTVMSTATEAANGDRNSISDTIDFEVEAVADQPNLTVPATVTVAEDTNSASFVINSSLADSDGSEALLLEISDIPVGTRISDGTHTFVATSGSTTANVSTWILNNLTITPPANSGVDFDLTVMATATEGENLDQATNSDVIHVVVTAVADQPTLTIPSTVAVDEDTQSATFSVSASLNDLDGSESLAIEVGNVPVGAVLSDGLNTFTSTTGNAAVDITAWNLANLQITAPADSDTDFTVTVTATATEAENSHQNTNTDSIDVVVNAIADQPALTVPSTITVNEDNQSTPFTISSSLTDTDGSETLLLTIGDIPVGARLTDGGNFFVASTEIQRPISRTGRSPV